MSVTSVAWQIPECAWQIGTCKQTDHRPNEDKPRADANSAMDCAWRAEGDLAAARPALQQVRAANEGRYRASAQVARVPQAAKLCRWCSPTPSPSTWALSGPARS